MSFLSQPLSFLSIPPTRNFAGISGYVTISESTVDSLEITQHPVQQGASISDHAFKKPVVLSIQMLFGGGGLGGSGLGGQSLSSIYQSLLALQQPTPSPTLSGTSLLSLGSAPPAALTPFIVTTPKRTYYNMLLVSLGCTTDKKTENVLSINASFQEVILVPITTTNVPASQLKNAGSNSGTQNAGEKSVIVQGANIFK